MDEGIWLDILDYAQQRKVSISTVRRYIKSGKVKYRKMAGKYLIYSYVQRPPPPPVVIDALSETIILKKRVRELEDELSDIKTLLKLYEQKQERSSIHDSGPPPFSQNN